MSNYEYEDELERMRARRKRKQATSPRQGNRRNASDEDWDEDFFTDFDEDPSGSPMEAVKPVRSSRKTVLERAADNYIDDPSDFSNNFSSEYAAQDLRRRPKRKHKGGRRVWLFLVFVVILITAALFLRRWMKDRDGYWNIAVFGVDSRNSNLEKDALADVQMIASINKKTGEIRLVSVYRDTYVQIDDKGTFHKINEAYFKGGHKQALETLKRNLDVSVDDYATFNWKAVADAINILGGVDLEITDSEFKYINSFITETVESTGVYSTHLASAGMNHLDGVQAVAYSRLRLMDTDFNRTERQRKVVMLALDKAKTADFNTLQTVVRTVIPEISTSIGVEDVVTIAKDVNHYYLGQTGGFPFAKTTADVGKLDCVIPMTLESNVVLLHQFLFEDTGYTASSSVKKISAKISETTGVYEEGKASGGDGNLGGVTGSTGSSGSSGGTGHSENENAQNQVQTEPETESTTEAPSTEESSTEETASETTVSETSEPVIVKPLEPEETTAPKDSHTEGPGSGSSESSGAVIYNQKPVETTEEAYGPGFENSASGDSANNDAAVTEAP